MRSFIAFAVVSSAAFAPLATAQYAAQPVSSADASAGKMSILPNAQPASDVYQLPTPAPAPSDTYQLPSGGGAIPPPPPAVTSEGLASLIPTPTGIPYQAYPTGGAYGSQYPDQSSGPSPTDGGARWPVHSRLPKPFHPFPIGGYKGKIPKPYKPLPSGFMTRYRHRPRPTGTAGKWGKEWQKKMEEYREKMKHKMEQYEHAHEDGPGAGGFHGHIGTPIKPTGGDGYGQNAPVPTPTGEAGYEAPATGGVAMPTGYAQKPSAGAYGEGYKVEG